MDGIGESFQLIIWDLFLLEGNTIIFKAAFALMKMLNKDLSLIETYDDIQNIMNNILLNYENTAKLLYYISIKKYSFFTHNNIRKYRLKLLKSTYDNISKLGVFLSKNIIDDENLECDLDWPICVNDKTYKNEIIDFLAFRTLLPPKITEDYFFKEINSNNIIKKEEFNDKEYYFSELLIQRRIHTCHSNIHTVINFINEKKNNKSLERENLKNYISQRELIYFSVRDFQIKKEKDDKNIIEIMNSLPIDTQNLKINQDKEDKIIDKEEN
jgi:hypothetical protein